MFEDGEIRQVALIPGPAEVEAQYFVLFVPDEIRGRVEALSAVGEVFQSIQVGTPPRLSRRET
jgi:hypothetical protein